MAEIQVNEINDLQGHLPKNSKLGTSKVAEVCEKHADKKRTARKMLKHLQSIGFPVNEKRLGSISGCLLKLARDQELAIVQHGVGSTPSVYQWKVDDGTTPSDKGNDDSGEHESE